MKDSIFKVISNEKAASRTFRMVLEGDTLAISGSGQFVQVSLPGYFLRRPISIHEYDDRYLTLIYRVVGQGTTDMSRLQPGDTLSVITGLGKCFDIDACRRKALLIGGGVGAAPLYELGKELLAQGKEVTVILGFNSKDEIFLVEEFKNICANVIITTVDGSVGIKGFVTDALSIRNINYDYFYACGPRVMMKAVCERIHTAGQVSMEERMGCGFGICYGCTCNTKSGPKRVCKDGPVFNKEEIIW